MTNAMFSKMNEEQLSEYLNGDSKVLSDKARAEFKVRAARAVDWHSGNLALPVWGKPGVYKTKSQLAKASA